MLVRDFEIHICKEEVLQKIQCDEASEIYKLVAKEYDEIVEEIKALCEPVFLMEKGVIEGVAEGNPVLMVLYSIGCRVSDYSTKAFETGNYIKGLLADAMADVALFGLEEQYEKYLKEVCDTCGMGIKKRLEPPRDITIEAQKIVWETTRARELCGIELTTGYMLDPVKSNIVLYLMGNDAKSFKHQHDCSKCTRYDCKMRQNVPKENPFLTVADYEIPCMNENEENKGYGVAVDIGTTTIVMQLVDKKEKQIKATYTSINHQRMHGTDVISRIQKAVEGSAEELKAIIQKDLQEGFLYLLRQGELDAKEIREVVIAGNTTMIHLLMGYDCTGLSTYPFTPVSTEAIEENSKVRILPGISAFVGADIVSGMYLCDMDQDEEISLLIDLGTNGEIVLGNRERFLSTSVAAGPAFEGGNILYGTASVEGAVSGVSITERGPSIKTIGNKPPIGICGTGAIELVAELLRTGQIDETGYMEDEYPVALTAQGNEIVFMPKDIREIQLAKAAICAGIEILIAKYGIFKEDISNVYLAGGFGYHLDCKKAIAIGLIPKEFADKIKTVGNSSLGGAVKCLLCREDWERVKAIPKLTEEIQLATEEAFQQLYMKSMYFEKIKEK